MWRVMLRLGEVGVCQREMLRGACLLERCMGEWAVVLSGRECGMVCVCKGTGKGGWNVGRK